MNHLSTTHLQIKNLNIKAYTASNDKNLHPDIIERFSMDIHQGEFIAIIGPNGAGKTTLLNALSGDSKKYSGDIILSKKCIKSLKPKTLACLRAVLPQTVNIQFPMLVKDIITLGRQMYKQTEYQAFDNNVIDLCIQQLDLNQLADKYYHQLSGGEKQRVHIARVFAQIYLTGNENNIKSLLLLDEPVNNLDIYHQYSLLSKLKQLNLKGLTVIAIIHDLSMAVQFSDRLILLNKHSPIVKSFTPDELIKGDILKNTYNIDIHSYWQEEINRYLLAPSLS